jgi:hypothetical protein
MSKRIGVFAVASLLICLLAVPAQGQMSAGIQGGVTLADLGGDVTGTDMKVGFAGGAFFGYQLHEYFRLQVAGQYVQKGAKEEDGDGKIKVDYIEALVPLTLTIPIENSPLMPRVYAGPAVAFEMSCKITDGDSVDCEDVGQKTKSVDFGVFFGGGVDFMVGNGAIMLDVLYNLGLANINDEADSDEFSVKNKNFQFMAGYRFFLGS